MLLYKPITRWHKIKEINRRYKKVFGREPNLGNPRTFNEKIQWLKLNYKDIRATRCADKVTARDYIAEQVGNQYLIPIISIHNTPEEINWQKLPKKFVIKISNGYNQNIICMNKDKLNVEETVNKLQGWLKPMNGHYWRNFEWNYKNTRPHILIEKFMGDKNNQIKEYKFMYLSGELAFVVAEERTLENTLSFKQTLFNERWERLEVTREGHPPSDKIIPRPKSFSTMLEISKKLAKDFPICRVDLYEIGGDVKVGEMTFSPANGLGRYIPREWDWVLGDKINLPQRNNFTLLEWQPIEINMIDWFHKFINRNQ